jgi:hypothetical protein
MMMQPLDSIYLESFVAISELTDLLASIGKTAISLEEASAAELYEYELLPSAPPTLFLPWSKLVFANFNKSIKEMPKASLTMLLFNRTFLLSLRFYNYVFSKNNYSDKMYTIMAHVAPL